MDGIHINLGAGDYPIDGHLNCDSQPKHGIARVFRAPPLPFDDASVESIFAGHFLEHLPVFEVLPLLHECARVLIAGGSLTLVCPDANKARLSYESKRLIPERLSEILCGGKDADMPHHSLWDAARLRAVVERAGFQIDESYNWKSDWRVQDRQLYFQCGVRGVKA